MLDFLINFKGQNQSGGTGGRGDGKKDDKVALIFVGACHY